MQDMVELVERLSATAGALELAMAKMIERQESLVVEAQETVDRIVATVESAREAELEKKLAEAEAKIAELSAGGFVGGRKTLAAGVGRMFAKDGSMGEGLDAGALDVALTSLSVEQRIAVKSALLRSGMVG